MNFKPIFSMLLPLVFLPNCDFKAGNKAESTVQKNIHKPKQRIYIDSSQINGSLTIKTSYLFDQNKVIIELFNHYSPNSIMQKDTLQVTGLQNLPIEKFNAWKPFKDKNAKCFYSNGYYLVCLPPSIDTRFFLQCYKIDFIKKTFGFEMEYDPTSQILINKDNTEIQFCARELKNQAMIYNTFKVNLNFIRKPITLKPHCGIN